MRVAGASYDSPRTEPSGLMIAQAGRRLVITSLVVYGASPGSAASQLKQPSDPVLNCEPEQRLAPRGPPEVTLTSVGGLTPPGGGVPVPYPGEQESAVGARSGCFVDPQLSA